MTTMWYGLISIPVSPETLAGCQLGQMEDQNSLQQIFFYSVDIPSTVRHDFPSCFAITNNLRYIHVGQRTIYMEYIPLKAPYRLISYSVHSPSNVYRQTQHEPFQNALHPSIRQDYSVLITFSVMNSAQLDHT